MATALLKKKATKRYSKIGAGKKKTNLGGIAPTKKLVKLSKGAGQFFALRGLNGKKPSITSLIKAAEAGKVSTAPQGFKRPHFSSAKQEAARLEATLATGVSYMRTNLDTADLAAPHRAPYSALRDTILSDSPQRVRAVMTLLGDASKVYEAGFAKAAKPGAQHVKEFSKLQGLYASTRENMEAALKDYETSSKGSPAARFKFKLKLVVAVNNLASNAPGLGPHTTANLVVSDNLHLCPVNRQNEPYSPRSQAARLAYPQLRVAVASAKGSLKQVISVSGALHSVNDGKMPFKVVNHKSTAFYGALYVSPTGNNVLRPKNPTSQVALGFNADYIKFP